VTTDTLTVLSTALEARRRLACKFIIADSELTPERRLQLPNLKPIGVTPDGQQIWERGCDKATRFTSTEHPVASIDQLASVLRAIEPDPYSLVIRGAPTEAALMAASAGRPVRRSKNPLDGEPGYFAARARHYLMIDIDDLLCPNGIDPVSLEALEHAIAQLPPEFHQASYFYQWSSKAGLKPGLIKLHVWFWLDRPIADEEVKLWANAWNAHVGFTLIDPALYDPVQAHYVASPRFFGVEDPVLVRSGLVRKAQDAVALQLPERTWVSVSSRLPRQDRADAGQDGTGKAIDGRESLLRDLAWRMIHEGAFENLEAFAEEVWRRFEARAVTGPTTASSNSYRHEDALAKCRPLWRKLERGEIQPRKPVPEIAAYYPTQPVTKEVASARLEAVIRSFLHEPRDVGVRVTAGAGKTSTAAALVARELQPGEVVHWFVPTLQLSREIAEKIRAANPGILVKVIEGRSETNCRRHELVRQVGELGMHVQRTCCDASQTGIDLEEAKADPLLAGVVDHRCPFLAECPYQQQFKDRAQIYLFTVQHICLDKRDEIPAPDLIVVDERFYPELVKVKELELDSLLKARDDRLGWQVHQALKSGAPLLEALRSKGVTPAALKAAQKAEADYWYATSRLAISPGMDVETALERVRGSKKLPRCFHLFRALAEEMELPDRAQGLAVALEGEMVRVRWVADHRLKAPTLFLDATGDETILRAIKPGIEFHAIDVQRRTGQVVQVVDQRLSKSSLIKERDAARNLARVQRVLDRFAADYERALVVTYKAVEDAKALTVPEGWEIAHFGAIRGIDRWRDFDAVFVVGNPLPPIQPVEDQAAVLAMLSGADVQLPGAWSEELRGYRIADGSRLGVKVKCHPNPLADACLRQHREAEIIQALDRLRMIHAERPKDVFLLTSVVVDLTVTRATTLDELGGERGHLDVLLERFGGVVPLSAGWLAERAPDLFATREIAKWWLRKQQDFKGGICYNNTIANPPFEILIGQYRVEGRAGGKPARFLARADHLCPRRALEALVGPLSLCELPQQGSTPATAFTPTGAVRLITAEGLVQHHPVDEEAA
jgi:hypothetical protein